MSVWYPYQSSEISPYRIYDLYPKDGAGGYGFAIYLNHEIANKIKKLSPDLISGDFVLEAAQKILKKLGFYESRGLYFHGKTLLLQYCRVDGSACEIGVSEDEICREIYDDPLAYQPHNVNSYWQAYGLLSLWLSWFQYVETAINL